MLLDIDHSPRHLLSDSHAGFYTLERLASLQSHLNSGAVFALWSNDAPDPTFQRLLEQAFVTSEAHRVEFTNPYTGGTASATVCR